MPNWTLGQTSARYETSGRGPGTVSTGAGDNGGVSYGSYQLSTSMRTIHEFLRYNPEYGEKFKGLQPGTESFDDKWRAVAKADPTGFHSAQHDFIKHSHYDVQVDRLKVAGIDLSQRGAAVQDMLWSTSVQFRGLTKGIVTGALAGKDPTTLSDADIVSAVQDYKRDHNSELFSKSRSLWPGLLQRAANEKQDLLELARSYGGDKAPTQKASLSPAQERTLQQFKGQAGTRLAAQGLNAEQIDTVGLAALRHVQDHPGKVEPMEFLVSKDGSAVAVRHDSGQVSEFNVAEALRGSAGRAEQNPNPAGAKEEVLTTAQFSPDFSAPALSR